MRNIYGIFFILIMCMHLIKMHNFDRYLSGNAGHEQVEEWLRIKLANNHCIDFTLKSHDVQSFLSSNTFYLYSFIREYNRGPLRSIDIRGGRAGGGDPVPVPHSDIAHIVLSFLSASSTPILPLVLFVKVYFRSLTRWRYRRSLHNHDAFPSLPSGMSAPNSELLPVLAPKTHTNLISTTYYVKHLRGYQFSKLQV